MAATSLTSSQEPKPAYSNPGRPVRLTCCESARSGSTSSRGFGKEKPSARWGAIFPTWRATGATERAKPASQSCKLEEGATPYCPSLRRRAPKELSDDHRFSSSTTF
uniref:Uncharacterized protein n=1 Tax=Rhodosorus marinus TaxID=101924 RepID=A0A7S3AB11_9RHOD